MPRVTAKVGEGRRRGADASDDQDGQDGDDGDHEADHVGLMPELVEGEKYVEISPGPPVMMRSPIAFLALDYKHVRTG